MKQALALGILVVACWFVVGLAEITAGEHTKDSLETVKKNMSAKKAILVDVREKAEWDAGHLRDAKLLPLSEIPENVTSQHLEKHFPKGTILYLYCAAGGRCLQAADLMMKSGYDVRPLRDGYQSLLKNGFPRSEK